MAQKINIFQTAKSSGGVGVYTRRLVSALDAERYQITVACLAEGCETMAAELNKLPNVKAVSIPMKDELDPFSDLKVCYQLAQEIRKEKFDIIHAHTSKPGFFARLVSMGTGIPVLYQPANFAFHDGASKLQIAIYSRLERLAARFWTKKIIAVCNGERELAKRYFVGRDDQFITIYTGIDISPFNVDVDRRAIRESLGVPDDVMLVGTIARLTEAKAPADFIRAASRVHDRYPKVHFVWVGDGHLASLAHDLVQEHHLEDIFHFPGFRTDIPAILKSLDCFILSSHWEGFSLAILEAMAAGLPIISTRVMGADEALVDGETGLLVPIGDISALAAATERIIADPSLAKRLANQARKRVEQVFPFSVTVSKIEQLYEDVYSFYHR